MKNKFVISGSGISGLVAALLLCEKGYGKDTVIIEKNATAGGLLRKFSYGEHGDFDYGMHNFLETGIKELDELLFSLLPEDEWQLLAGEKRDLAGIYFNGKLQTNTPYIDLRSLDKKDYEECLADFFAHLNKGNFKETPDITLNAYDFAVKRYGKRTAESTVIPSIEKIHKKKATELDYMATVFTPMNRLAFADDSLVRELTKSSELAKYIAWSDQKSLPLEKSSGRRAYYPIKYGAYRVVESIFKRLKNAGVNIFTEREIIKIEESDHEISCVTASNKLGEVIEFNNPALVVWTGNIPALGKFLGTDFTGLRNDKPLKTVIVNMLLNKSLNMGDLYYFFCYDKRFHTYRLTNYVAYSNGAESNGQFKICIELLLDEELLKNGLVPEEVAKDELFRFGITRPDTEVLFAKAEVLDSGFPMPSSNNINALRKIKDDIKSKNLKNLLLSGILAENNLFFQTDVLIDVYQKISRI